MVEGTEPVKFHTASVYLGSNGSVVRPFIRKIRTNKFNNKIEGSTHNGAGRVRSGLFNVFAS